jgi:hypothetical protein
MNGFWNMQCKYRYFPCFPRSLTTLIQHRTLQITLYKWMRTSLWLQSTYVSTPRLVHTGWTGTCKSHQVTQSQLTYMTVGSCRRHSSYTLADIYLWTALALYFVHASLVSNRAEELVNHRALTVAKQEVILPCIGISYRWLAWLVICLPVCISKMPIHILCHIF